MFQAGWSHFPYYSYTCSYYSYSYSTITTTNCCDSYSSHVSLSLSFVVTLLAEDNGFEIETIT